MGFIRTVLSGYDVGDDPNNNNVIPIISTVYFNLELWNCFAEPTCDIPNPKLKGDEIEVQNFIKLTYSTYNLINTLTISLSIPVHCRCLGSWCLNGAGRWVPMIS